MNRPDPSIQGERVACRVPAATLNAIHMACSGRRIGRADLTHCCVLSRSVVRATVLTAFCRVATSLLRPTDLFGRIGGEEFASLLPDTERQDALVVAERLRAAFEATPHTLPEGSISATVSVGVAISDDESFDLSILLDAADQALYRAKALGGNRVGLSTHSATERSIKRRADLFSTV